MIDAQKMEKIEQSLEKIEKLGIKIQDHEALRTQCEERLNELNDLIKKCKGEGISDETFL